MITDQKISLAKLAQREGVNVSTCWRWAQRGVRGVKLATFSVGARRYTDPENWDRFVAATTAIAQGEQPAPAKAPTNRQREQSIREAERKLEQDGA